MKFKNSRLKKRIKCQFPAPPLQPCEMPKKASPAEIEQLFAVGLFMPPQFK